MLYWGEDDRRETCKKCHTSRFKTVRKGKKQKKKPAKILRYFPLKPRLQRLFMSSKTAQHMRWHEDDKNEDGKLGIHVMPKRGKRSTQSFQISRRTLEMSVLLWRPTVLIHLGMLARATVK
ncbi:hypothetical protein K1719_000375 [Acacia pycnantha]|nr:hypothetical protein K1719_000375 [Acacia pycnantha]